MQLRPGETLLNLQSNWKIEIEKFVELMKPHQSAIGIQIYKKRKTVPKQYPKSLL